MLKTMRKNVKSLAPTLWIIIASFVIAIFAVWGGGSRLGEGEGPKTIAVVGKEKISADLFNQTLRQRLEALQREFKQLNRNLIQQLNVPQQVLEQMIEQRLLLQLADEMALGASNQEIRDKIISFPAFQREGKFIGFEDYKQILDWNRISIAEFEESLKNQVIMTKVVQILTAGVTIIPEEIWENYKKANESAKLEYLVLEKSKAELATKSEAGQIQAYFEKNRDKYKLPERRSASYVYLAVADLNKEIKLTDAEIEKYYKDHQNQFREPERVKVSRIYIPYGDKDKERVLGEAQEILGRLNKEEDFAELAKKYSKDDKAREGGDWGENGWQSLSPKEQEEIRKLEKGKMSGLIEIEGGASILKVTDKVAERLRPLEEVKTMIKNNLTSQQARNLAAARIAQLEKTAKKEKSLDVAAQKSGYKIKNTGPLKESQALEDIDPSGFISQGLFKLKEKEISSALHTFDGVAIAQLEKIEQPREAKLEEVKADVEKDLLESEKMEKTLEKLNEIRPKLGEKDWEEIAQKNNLEYKSVNEHKREQYLGIIGENAEVDRLAFSLPLNEPSAAIKFDNGYAFIRILERKEVAKEDFEKNGNAEKATLLESKKNKFLQAYLMKFRQEKKVKVNYNLFLQANSDILSRFGEGE